MKAPIECWPIAVDRVRYVGEPVAIVVASDRYRAEDAARLDRGALSPFARCGRPGRCRDGRTAPLLHPARQQQRRRRAHVPLWRSRERAFAAAAHRVRVDVRYPRNSCTPIETYGIVAEYDAGEDVYDVLANFQGPFSLHPVMARALKVPGNRLRLRTPPDSGGSFGVKQAIFPYIVLIAVAARVDRAAGEMDRGSPGASVRVGVGDQPRHDAGSRGRSRRAHHGARLRSARGLRRASARAGARHALSHAWQSDRRLRHPPRQDTQPRRADQQNADRARTAASAGRKSIIRWSG